MAPFYLWATEYDTVVRTIEEITKNADQQRVLRLANASVLIADYDLIRADFPTTVDLSNPQIDEWLLKHVGYISDSQADQTFVNTPISVTGEERYAHRPPRYGRALVYEMFDPADANKQVGLTDAKGVGVVMSASHLCMRMRGVEKQNSQMKTSCMLGSFLKCKDTRAEFLQLIRD